MAQGVAIQALARAWQLTGDESDLELANRLLPGLKVSVSQGGLRAPDGTAWWPLYSFDPGERVLNGDLQVVISLYSYASLAGDDAVKAEAAAGAAEADSVLPDYDTGAWSRYDERHEADLTYHDLMTRQLGQLATMSGLPGFAALASRFALYRTEPPTLTAQPPSMPMRFYPAPVDGFRDTTQLQLHLSKRSQLSLTVRDADGDAVASQSLGWHDGGQVAVTWNGRARGAVAAPGVYDLDVSAVDLAGNRASPTDVGEVEVARDVTPPTIERLRVGRTPDGRLRVSWAVHDTETPSIALDVRVGNERVHLVHLAKVGSAVLPLRPARRAFHAEVRVSDTSGNSTTVTRRPA
jgi:hypothetical protein